MIVLPVGNEIWATIEHLREKRKVGDHQIEMEKANTKKLKLHVKEPITVQAKASSSKTSVESEQGVEHERDKNRPDVIKQETLVENGVDPPVTGVDLLISRVDLNKSDITLENVTDENPDINGRIS